MRQTIESLRNDRLRWVRRLAGDRRARRREGLWVAEGLRLAEEVLREGLRVRCWVFEEGWGGDRGREERVRDAVAARGQEALEVRRGLLCEVADTLHPQGVIVVFDAPGGTPDRVLGAGGPVVVLEGVQDPGNVGTVARTAEGAGAAGLLLARGCADPGSPKALRASAGALLRLPAPRVEAPLALLEDAGVPIVATVGEGGEPYDRVDLSGRFALVLGQEGSGLARDTVARAGRAVTVPMAGRLESLNVAATAAIVLFEAARQRRERGVG